MDAKTQHPFAIGMKDDSMFEVVDIGEPATGTNPRTRLPPRPVNLRFDDFNALGLGGPGHFFNTAPVAGATFQGASPDDLSFV